MKIREQEQPPNMLADIARECGHAALCCPHSGRRAKGE